MNIDEPRTRPPQAASDSEKSGGDHTNIQTRVSQYKCFFHNKSFHSKTFTTAVRVGTLCGPVRSCGARAHSSGAHALQASARGTRAEPCVPTLLAQQQYSVRGARARALQNQGASGRSSGSRRLSMAARSTTRCASSGSLAHSTASTVNAEYGAKRNSCGRRRRRAGARHKSPPPVRACRRQCGLTVRPTVREG